MKRSFISFTFGGRHIEDFNLIASTPGDRLNRSGSAAFDDNVSSYDNLNGQKYWGTHYKTNSIEFTLVTDGID
jgi:IS1 family transposase